MKRSLLRWLVCPRCKGELRLDLAVVSHGELWDGRLTCRSCSAAFPVRRGIPRFVDDDAYAASFALQWRSFAKVQLDSCNGTDTSARALAETTGLAQKAWQGRLVLDLGVGAGRFAEVAAANGAEVVAVDLSTAVDVARDALDPAAAVHFVQADVFALPFRPGSFDIAYAIGVLHHTPDPRAAFRCLAEMARPDGDVAVYVYDRYGWTYRAADLWRRLTTRLPRRLMLWLTALAGPLYPLYRLPLFGKVLQLLAPISSHPHWRWRWLDTFDWYTPRYQWKFLYPEVAQWFHDMDLTITWMGEGPIRMAGRRRSSARAGDLRTTS